MKAGIERSEQAGKRRFGVQIIAVNTAFLLYTPGIDLHPFTIAVFDAQLEVQMYVE
ncbi:MAG: hypothetical protein R2824_35610 [Saprospiraceae bacterium]